MSFFDISTAPKDGTVVYLIFRDLDFAPKAIWDMLEYDDGYSARMVWVFADPETEIGQCNGAVGWEDDEPDDLPIGWFPACAEYKTQTERE